jgi:hypothetical protein
MPTYLAYVPTLYYMAYSTGKYDLLEIDLNVLLKLNTFFKTVPLFLASNYL